MPIVCSSMGCLRFVGCPFQSQTSCLSLVPGGAARRSPNRATGGGAGHETNSLPGGESPSKLPTADHPISKQAAEEGITSVKENAAIDLRFQEKKGTDGRPY